MQKPRILLSANKNMQYYVDAVEGAGGIAVAKYLPEVDTDYDGLILCGGNDIDPKYYNEPMDGSVNIDSDRDTVEFALLKAYTKKGKPIMGICRGCQLINIYFGGSLYQDLAESALHTNRTDFYIAHEVTTTENSLLNRLYGNSFSVNSSHHQAVNKLGEELFPTAFWQGKYVEAYEHSKLPVFGFQWHPERMCFSQTREDTVDGSKIFEYFIKLCKA